MEFFPTHWLDIGVGAEYFNLIDFQPPFGIGIYDIVTSIGGVGNKPRHMGSPTPRGSGGTSPRAATSTTGSRSRRRRL